MMTGKVQGSLLFKVIFLNVALLSLTACPTLMTRNDVREVEQKRQVQDSVVTLQKANADVSNHFAEIDQELRTQSGRMEVLENRMNRQSESSEALKKQLEEQNQQLNQKIIGLQQELVRLEAEIGKVAVTAAAASNLAASSSSSAAPAAAKADQQDDVFSAAEKLFQAKDWRKAILAYNKYRDTYPRGRKFAEATYKIGVCFQELGMKDEAKAFYEEVVSKFPNSAEARRSRTRLKGLR